MKRTPKAPCSSLRRRATQPLACGLGVIFREQTGQSIAEVALVTPMLLLLLIGTIEVGRFAYYSIEVANAARAGVQYAAQSLADSKDIVGIQRASQNDAPNVSDLDVTSRDLCACSSSPANYVGCPARNCAPGHAVVFVEVNTSARFQSLFRYPGLASSLTVNGRAIMRVAQ
jgi:Flp pilus assembly protein TadG